MPANTKNSSCSSKNTNERYLSPKNRTRLPLPVLRATAGTSGIEAPLSGSCSDDARTLPNTKTHTKINCGDPGICWPLSGVVRVVQLVPGQVWSRIDIKYKTITNATQTCFKHIVPMSISTSSGVSSSLAARSSTVVTFPFLWSMFSSIIDFGFND